MVDFDVPGLPVEGLVVVDDELVRFLAGWDELSLCALVVETCD